MSCRRKIATELEVERVECGGQFFQVRRVISHQLLLNILSITSLEKISCGTIENFCRFTRI